MSMGLYRIYSLLLIYGIKKLKLAWSVLLVPQKLQLTGVKSTDHYLLDQLGNRYMRNGLHHKYSYLALLMIKGALRLTKCFALSDLRNRVAFAQRVQVPRPGEHAGLYDLLFAGPYVVS